MDAALSVIIPLAPGETLWRELLPRLQCEAADEVIVVSAEAAPPDWPPAAVGRARWLQCGGGGRAVCMNAGAAAARNPFLWFVHADSRPAAGAAAALRQSLARAPAAMHYFALRFYDGGWKMRVNEFGVRWRCLLFGNPFGDQALCVPAPLFEELRGFDEDAAYGEDHLLVLRARRAGAALRQVPAVVETSARRYVEQGWWRTLCLYQRLWWRQWRQGRR